MNVFHQLSGRLSKILLGFGLATAFLSLNTGCDERNVTGMHKLFSGQSANSIEATMLSNLGPVIDTATAADGRHPALRVGEIKPATASAQELKEPSLDLDRQ